MHDKVPKHIDESVLIEQCRKKDRSAQKLLFDHYYHKMMSDSHRYIKNDEEAQEVLNNAFLKVFQNIHHFRAIGSLEAWIKRIVINSAIDFIRSNKKYKNFFIEKHEILNEAIEVSEPEKEWFDYALEISKEEILQMVEELPGATKIVFYLIVIDEFSHKQIAERLKISTGTSKWHLSMARKYLKERINTNIKLKIKTSNHGA